VSAEERSDPNVSPGLNERDPGPTQAMAPGEAAGMVIGRYHLLQKIGEGGMGEVWLAEQKEPVRRRVALKLVKAGMNTREVIARFESERQALALMDHPAIAKVFDAGSTTQGAPYFVMEYVAGVPITDYCDNHRLSTPERLDLFMRVCEGVQHAHQKAIIHRDLKPSNILVTEVDGKAAPKIIDFGVAKALTQKLTPDTMFTRVGALIGTPEYMSPEQASSSGEDIDTRTDVYSLGVVFYELLAGAPPLELRKVAFEEFLRKLREDEAPKPSTTIRAQDLATSTEIGRKRQTEPLVLAKQMRGDLDSIALKALEKDRSRRYGSPSDFAADVKRYLNNEAVLAVPPSAAYRARKFARRYRVALATACAFALVLIVASVVSLRQSIRANRESAVAQAVNDFLQNDLLAQASADNQSGPSAKPDPDLKVRTALDRAAVRIAGKFDREPEVEAAIRDTMGKTYRGLGVYAEARKQLEEALRLRRKVLGAENPQTLRTASDLAWLTLLQGKYPETEILASRTLESQRRVLGPEHPDTLVTMNTLAGTYRYQGKDAQAEALFKRILEIRRRVLGPEHPQTLATLNNLAGTYREERKYSEAETLFSQDLELERRVLGPEDPRTLLAMGNLARTYVSEGKYAQAETLHSQVLDVQRRVLGPHHPDTLASMTNLGEISARQGKYAQAETFYSQALEGERQALGPEHPATVRCMGDLGFIYLSEGKYAQAEPLLVQALDIQRRVSGPEHPDTIAPMDSLAELYRAEGKYAQAETLYSQTLELERRVFGPKHPNTLTSTSGLALTYYLQGKYAQAEDLYAQTLAERKHGPNPNDPDTLDNMADLGLTYQAQGKFASSETLAREAVERNRTKRPEDWQRFFAESLLGASLAGQKKYTEAELLLLGGYQGMVERKSQIEVPNSYHLDYAREWIGQLYRAWGKPQKAAEWTKK
jgi:eukaryotic-like serine/threonine-protein kinase